jgi:hypothetical protein
MVIGAAIFVVSAAQVAVAFLLRRSGQAPAWLIAASISLMAAMVLQMASGRLRLFALHLPLGAGLFGASLALAIWAWMSRSAQTTSRQASTLDAAFTLGRLKMEDNACFTLATFSSISAPDLAQTKRLSVGILALAKVIGCGAGKLSPRLKTIPFRVRFVRA